MARQNEGPRLRPVAWARAEDVQALHEQVEADAEVLASAMEALQTAERAIVALAAAVLELQQVVFEDEEPEEYEAPDPRLAARRLEPGEEPGEFEERWQPVEVEQKENGDGSVSETITYEEVPRDAAGQEAVSPGADDPDAAWAAAEAARLRAEAANEATPSEREALALSDDPNAILDVPDEGIVIQPGRDEPEMQR